jgi:Chaperone of endosialidase/Domain of unknown function (DUF5011)
MNPLFLNCRTLFAFAIFASFGLLPALASASYQPGQTLDPACPPSDATCIVVPTTASSTNISASFQATSTTATSTFAGSTSVAGTASSTNVVVSNVLTIGRLNGILKAVAGVVTTALVNLSTDVTGILGISNGGTGTTTAPTYGQVLIGNASGGYTLTATSSLGIASSPWAISGSNISYNSGNVGIGTTSPFTNFSVNGSGFLSGNLNVGSTTLNPTYAGSGSISKGLCFNAPSPIAAANHCFGYGTTGPEAGQLELVTNGGNNVFDVEQLNPLGFAAMTFRGTSPYYTSTTTPFEQLAIGSGGNSLGYSFIEASGFDGNSNPLINPNALIIQQTGGVDTLGGINVTCAIVSGSANATCSNNAGANGTLITGTAGTFPSVNGIPAATTVSSGGGTTNIVMSALATVTNAAEVLNFSNPTYAQRNVMQFERTGGIDIYNWDGSINTFFSRNVTKGVSIGGTDNRGELTVQKSLTSTYSPNSDPGDPGRTFVQENTEANIAAANQFVGLTLQLAPTLAIGGPGIGAGRVLSDIRAVRQAASSSDMAFVFSAFGNTGGYKDYLQVSSSTNWFLGNLKIGGSGPVASTLGVNGNASVGAGYTANTAPANGLLVQGSIGIGTTTPYSRLTVWGTDSASSTLSFNVVNSASTTVFAVFNGGNAQLSGTLTQSSDARLKTNIQSLDASTSLAAINSLAPVAYDWIDPNKDGTRQYGFNAQQVEQVFPNLVSTTSATELTPDGTLGLNYLGLIAPLVEAVQTLSADLSSLATRVSSLETAVAGFANSFHTQQLCVGSTCINQQQLADLLALEEQGQVQISAPTPPTISGTTTPPSISIQGNNPATINVGDAYTDLGAIVTDNQGHDLSYRTFINGTLVSNILIDTSTIATDTIDYVAIDTWGNTATSTRTIIVESASSSPSI